MQKQQQQQQRTTKIEKKQNKQEGLFECVFTFFCSSIHFCIIRNYTIETQEKRNMKNGSGSI